jgi:hypothetical protein
MRPGAIGHVVGTASELVDRDAEHDRRSAHVGARLLAGYERRPALLEGGWT